jgi:hypothetical protein
MEEHAMKVINMDSSMKWLWQWIKIFHQHVHGLGLELPSVTDQPISMVSTARRSLE